MNRFDELRDGDLVLDSLPDEVRATIEVRDAHLQNLGLGGSVGLEFIVEDLRRWLPGQSVRVAFLDGDDDLHRAIMEQTAEITAACNLTLDFGETAAGGFRRWTEQDTDYAAEIRISFDKAGYFSLVGIDSIDENVGPSFGTVGGHPHQASLNLGGFAVRRPAGWAGTVRHEFLHALGFHHSHQNMRGPCQASFRWEDDEGYQPTRDERGMFIPDPSGRRPGIYTYLGGFPNFWDRAKVDHNLKTEEDPRLVVGPFDRASVMLYRFPDLFYKTIPNPCAPSGDGQSLSEGDRRGLQLLYPGVAADVEAAVARQRAILSAVEGAMPAEQPLTEAASDRGTSLQSGVVDVLRRKLGR